MRVGDTRTVTIAGAGLAGSLLAVLLARRGFRVDLLERHDDPRRDAVPAGRSINLALAERGRHALREAGLLDRVDEFTLPMRGRMLHAPDGALTLQPYGARDDEVIWSVHRSLLNLALLDAAEATGRVNLRFGQELRGVDWENRRIRFLDDASPKLAFEVLVGADGAGSAVRAAMGSVVDLGVSEDLLDHAYREFTIPPAPGGEFALDPAALHIWPRGGFMLIALPNADASFTATLFLAKSGTPSFAELEREAAGPAFFRREFPDAVPLMPDLESEFRTHPVGLLGTVRCRRWRLGGQAVLLGDAAHAVVPFHGQGMNAAFEDCVEFARLTADQQREWGELFAEFEARRVDNANAIADMALENYTIMREAVRDPRFLLRKALEHELERRHPRRFVARYSLVMFHRVPYAEAYRRGEIQALLLDELLDGVGSLEAIDWDLAASQVRERLEPIEE